MIVERGSLDPFRGLRPITFPPPYLPAVSRMTRPVVIVTGASRFDSGHLNRYSGTWLISLAQRYWIGRHQSSAHRVQCNRWGDISIQARRASAARAGPRRIPRDIPMRYVRRSPRCKRSLLTIRGSSANEAALTDALSSFIKTHNRLDGLVLNAGVLEPLGPIADDTISLAAWKSHFDVNFFSLIPALRTSLPALRSVQGKVVFVSSGAAVGGLAGWAPYNASKAALNSLCR